MDYRIHRVLLHLNNKLQELTNLKSVNVSIKEYNASNILLKNIITYINKLKNKDLIDNSYEYNNFKLEFEKSVFKVLKPIRYIDSSKNDLYEINRDYFIEYFKEKYDVKYLKMWLDDKNKRLYEKIEFNPLNNNPGVYNTFKGFEFDTSDCELNLDENNLFFELLKHVTQNEYIKFIDWVSHIIQKPQLKTSIAVVLYSEEQGIGKSLISNFLTKLLSPYTSFLDSVNDINKRFNSDLVNCFLIIGDEIKAVRSDNMDLIKTIKKGIDSTKINDFANYLFMTNNRLNFKLDYNDRRFLMIECTNIKKDKEFYIELNKLLNNDEFIRQLFKYFKQRTIETDFTNIDVIKNEYKKEILFNNIKSYVSFIYLNTHVYCGRRLTSEEFYNKSIEYAKSKNLSTAYTIQEFRRYTTKVFKDFKTMESITNRVYYDFRNYSSEQILKVLEKHNQEYYNYLFNS